MGETQRSTSLSSLETGLRWGCGESRPHNDLLHTKKSGFKHKAEGAGPREGLRRVSKKAAQSKAGLWRMDAGFGVLGVIGLSGQTDAEE